MLHKDVVKRLRAKFQHRPDAHAGAMSAVTGAPPLREALKVLDRKASSSCCQQWVARIDRSGRLRA